MRCKSTMLGGAGLAAIAGAFILASSPAFAQMGNYTNPMTHIPGTPSQPDVQGTAKDLQQKYGQATATQPLNTVSNPSTTLATATVQDSSGQSVGQVKTVNTSASGMANSVAVSLTSGDKSGKVVTIKANKLRFDPNANILKSSLTLQEINQLPTMESP